MKKSSKWIATLIIVFVFLTLNGLIQLDSGPGGRNPGMLGVIFMVALIIAIRAVWKSKPEVPSNKLKKD